MANGTTKGFDELIAAIKRNPKATVYYAGVYFQRSMSLYRRTIQNSPWVMGGKGGGSPVDQGVLRDSHRVEYRDYAASIAPNRNGQAPYAGYVHGTDGKTQNIRGVQLRPWLDYAKDHNERGVQSEYRKMLDSIVKDLAN